MTGIAQPAAPLSVESLAQLTLSLLAVVALIVVVGWVVKRLKLTQVRGGRGDIEVVDQLTLGARERIMLIRVGDSQVLVGVGAAGLVALTPLATSIALKPSSPGPVFADRLREFLGRAGDSP